MWSFLLRIWESGVATEPASRLLDPAPPGYRGAPVLDAERCDACGSCELVCPAGAVVMTPDGANGAARAVGAAGANGAASAARTVRWTLHLGKCIYCGLCSDTCPAAALSHSRIYALAAFRPGDLLISAQVRCGGVPG